MKTELTAANPMYRDMLDEHIAFPGPDPFEDDGVTGGMMFFPPRCHKGAGLNAVYAEGVLRLLCAVCDECVIDLAIASHPNSPRQMSTPMSRDGETRTAG